MSGRVLLAHSRPRPCAVLAWLITDDSTLGAPTVVTTGQDAIACGQDVDVALVDLGLGGIDALQTIRALKRARPQLPVLVLGAGVPYLRAAAEDAGADEFVDDGFPGERVLAALRRAFGASTDQPAGSRAQ